MRRIISLSILGLLVLALAITVCAGIWTGDERWLMTAWLPGLLATIMFCFMPIIIGVDEL